MGKKIVASVIVSLVVGISFLGIFYYRLVVTYNSLRKALDEVERLDLTVDTVTEAGCSFLENSLWNETERRYQVTPSDLTYYGDDNYLAYIFHATYPHFKNNTKASMIRNFLRTDPPRLDLGRRRWIVLSPNYSHYETYNGKGYADQVALDGIFFARTNETTKAQDCFDLIIEMYDTHVELIEDDATELNRHEYYKIALASILACYLDNSTYISIFTRRLIQLQRFNGSWLTDDLDMETTYANTETTLLILLALDYYRN